MRLIALVLACSVLSVMAQPLVGGIKISALPSADRSNEPDFLPFVQVQEEGPPTTKQITVKNLFTDRVISNATLLDANLVTYSFNGLDITNLIVSLAGSTSNSIANAFGRGTNIAFYGKTLFTNFTSVDGLTRMDQSSWSLFSGNIEFTAGANGIICNNDINVGGNHTVAGGTFLGDSPGQLTKCAGPLYVTNYMGLPWSPIPYIYMSTNGNIKMKDNASVTTFIGHGFVSNSVWGIMLSANGDANVNALVASGNTELAGNLTVDGVTHFGDLGTLVAQADAYGNIISTNIDVRGFVKANGSGQIVATSVSNSTFGLLISTAGNATFNSVINNGNDNVAGNLIVDGNTTFGDLGSQVANIDAYGNATVSNLTVKGIISAPYAYGAVPDAGSFSVKLAGPNAPVTITNLVATVTNLFVGNQLTGLFTNLMAGYYHIRYSTTAASDQHVTDDVYSGIYTNTVRAGGTKTRITSMSADFVAAGGLSFSMSSGGILYLPANSQIALKIWSDSLTITNTINAASLVITTP